MKVLHPEQLNSSLGISKALQEEYQSLDASDKYRKRVLTDTMFLVPTKQSNILIWARFYMALYYKRLSMKYLTAGGGCPWYTSIDDFIILGALPTPSLIKTLHNQYSVDTVINVCYEFPGYEKLYKELNIKQIKIPTPDFTMPTVDSIRYATTEIMQRIRDRPSSKIYLHCKAGASKSAAIAMCYLSKAYHLNLTECQTLLSRKRWQVDKNLCQDQEIKMYYKKALLELEKLPLR